MDRVDQVLQKAQARLSVPQGGQVPPPINQGAQGLLDYVGRNQPQAYVPFAPGTPTLSGKQFALSEANTTGYYAPAEMRSMLDQIQQNKQLNISTQDDAQRQQAQAQNHALYAQLKNYGIDGESQFNTADDSVNAQNLANAYKGQPTQQKLQNDWQQQYQQNSQDLANKQFGLSQDEFSYRKSQTALNENNRKATGGYIAEIMTHATDRNSALNYLKQNQDHITNDGGDIPTIMKWIEDMYPQTQQTTSKIPVPNYDPDKWKSVEDWLNDVQKIQGK